MLPTVNFCGIEMTKMLIGANPFGGFSHQNKERDEQMRNYHTPERIIETWNRAWKAGINTFVTNNENSKEIIMGVVNDEVYNSYNDLPWTLHLCTMHWKYCYHANTVTQYWGGVCATPEFAKARAPMVWT